MIFSKIRTILHNRSLHNANNKNKYNVLRFIVTVNGNYLFSNCYTEVNRYIFDFSFNELVSPRIRRQKIFPHD